MLKYIKKAALYLLSLFLIYPLSPVLFQEIISLKEPSFICPVCLEAGITVRADRMGDGHFGARRSGGRRRHKGLDIEAAIGTPVIAAKSGIARTGNVPGGMGNYVNY